MLGAYIFIIVLSSSWIERVQMLLVIIFAYGVRCGAKFTFCQMAMQSSQYMLLTSLFLSQ